MREIIGKKKRGYDRYNSWSSFIGFVFLYAVLIWLIYLNTIALMTPFIPAALEKYAISIHSSVENASTVVNLSFNPELWVVHLMNGEPKVIVLLIWLIAFVFWVSYIFAIPYTLVMATDSNIWPLNKFRVFFFGKE